MIVSFEAPMGTGMTCSSLYYTYQLFLEGKAIMSGYKLVPLGKMVKLTRREFIREMSKIGKEVVE